MFPPHPYPNKSAYDPLFLDRSNNSMIYIENEPLISLKIRKFYFHPYDPLYHIPTIMSFKIMTA
ncbi:hypothetical protein FDI40_gp530 [Agrobacterium phage Atu_ph07]|uniref:Uncharacterized protein n=1 Tax=Agrobacterium phage Atu_ph07 TaxID=2024264 RepID=A0A2L0V0H9_9CAUD|nr:hypothetical protein FDI40_gp530 [Agrobacterium phage Atu_ph07]AUZ95289.1 hypothetical protein [Agrobacterium phage Atu_ph07]